MKEKLTSAMRNLEEKLEICLSSRQCNVGFFFSFTGLLSRKSPKYSLVILIF